MDTLLVEITKQGKAVNFYLNPKVREALVENFPEAKPIKLLQIPYEIEDSLEPHKEVVINHIIPIITGLSSEKTKQIGTLLFLQPLTKHEFLKEVRQTQNEYQEI